MIEINLLKRLLLILFCKKLAEFIIYQKTCAVFHTSYTLDKPSLNECLYSVANLLSNIFDILLGYIKQAFFKYRHFGRI